MVNGGGECGKMGEGGMTWGGVKFDVYGVRGGLMQVLEHRAADKGLQLTCRCAEEVPRYVNGDATKLRQVLMNLLGNAIKFTATGYVTLLSRLLSRSFSMPFLGKAVSIMPDDSAMTYG